MHMILISSKIYFKKPFRAMMITSLYDETLLSLQYKNSRNGML